MTTNTSLSKERSVKAPKARSVKAPKADAELVKFLSKPMLAEEQGVPRSVKSMPWIIAGLIAGCLGIAAFAEVSESATAQGQIVPSGAVKVVQHLEGGIVAEILVSDGEQVAPGQPLIRLDPAAIEPELQRMRARAASLTLTGERLRALILDRDPEFGVGDQYPDLVRNERDNLYVQRRDRDNQRAVLQARLRQQQVHIETLKRQRTLLEEQMGIAKQLVDMRATLLEKGLTSRVSYLEALRQYSQTNGMVAENLGKLDQAQEDLAEAESSLLELDSRLRKEAQTELGEVTAELAQVIEAMEVNQDRVNRLVVRAPAEGIVSGSTKRTIGGVVRPGETIMEIVPITDKLEAEVRLSPRDIGHTVVGQPARVEVSTYDASIHGAVDGRLSRISASTFTDENGQPFYKGIVELERDHVGNDTGRYPILPGMEASVDIVTGKRTLLRYLLKPVYRALDGAFHER